MSTEKKYPLVSGRLSLDLVNTEVVKRGIRHDLMSNEKDVADWIQFMKQSSPLISHSLEGKDVLSREVSALKELRTVLREGFEHIADGKKPERSWISQLEALNKQAPLSFQFIEGSLVPIPTGTTVDSIGSLIAFDVLQLLENGQLLSLHRCANRACVLLFLDTTGRRKWCSMKTCGNRTKVARHQIRHKES